METLGTLPSPTQSATASAPQPANITQPAPQSAPQSQISGNTRVSQLQPGQLSQSQLSQLQSQNMGNINVGQLTVDQLRQVNMTRLITNPMVLPVLG